MKYKVKKYKIKIGGKIMDREKLREIFKIAIPAMGEMTLYTMIWILDTMMIGKYAGQIGLSSVGLSTEIIYSFYHILVVAGISTALTSLIAINLGAKNYENAKLFALVGIQLAILVGLFFFITILFFPAPILKFFGATDIILPHAVKYCKICALTFFLFYTKYLYKWNFSWLKRHGNISLCCRLK